MFLVVFLDAFVNVALGLAITDELSLGSEELIHFLTDDLTEGIVGKDGLFFDFFLMSFFNDLFLLIFEDEEVSNQEAVEHRGKHVDAKDAKATWGGFAAMGEDMVDAKSNDVVMERVGWDDELGDEDAKEGKSDRDAPSDKSAQKEFPESILSFALPNDEMVKEITGNQVKNESGTGNNKPFIKLTKVDEVHDELKEAEMDSPGNDDG